MSNKSAVFEAVRLDVLASILPSEMFDRVKAEAKTVTDCGIQLVIEVDGGVVQESTLRYSEGEPGQVSITVCDYDVSGVDEGNLVDVNRPFGDQATAQTTLPTWDPEFVQALFNAMDERDNRATTVT